MAQLERGIERGPVRLAIQRLGDPVRVRRAQQAGQCAGLGAPVPVRGRERRLQPPRRRAEPRVQARAVAEQLLDRAPARLGVHAPSGCHREERIRHEREVLRTGQRDEVEEQGRLAGPRIRPRLVAE